MTIRDFNQLGDLLVALVNKIRMLALAARKGHRVERAPDVVIEDAIGRMVALPG